MFTLKFVRPNDLVTPLNINSSFYDMTIIKNKKITWHINVK